MENNALVLSSDSALTLPPMTENDNFYAPLSKSDEEFKKTSKGIINSSSASSSVIIDKEGLLTTNKELWAWWIYAWAYEVISAVIIVG